jgi:acetylglutamate kinase
VNKLSPGTTDTAEAANTLAEALPYLQRYDGATIVIKFGGNAMGDAEHLRNFARDVVLLKQCGIQPIVVHGGGPMINEMLDRLGIRSEFVEGKRVTDESVVEVVEMILSGSVNKKIVQAINSQGGKAVGLSGKDASLMICEKDMKTVDRDGQQVYIDLGFVGKPTRINPDILNQFLETDLIPVVAPVGMGLNGETFNVNGDTAAGAIAAAMKAERFLLLTDVVGVLDENRNHLTKLTAEDVKALTRSGVISGGMIPKTQTALDALSGGAKAVVILDGRKEHAVLLELLTEHGAGTLISEK